MFIRSWLLKVRCNRMDMGNEMEGSKMHIGFGFRCMEGAKFG